MPPIEILRGKIDPKSLEERRVYGVIYYQSEREKPFPREELQERLREALTSDAPEGFLKSEEYQSEWLLLKKRLSDEFGDEALTNLFPEQGHSQYTAFLHILLRNGIYTIPQLVERGERVFEISLIGKKRRQAVRLILDYFRGG